MAILKLQRFKRAGSYKTRKTLTCTLRFTSCDWLTDPLASRHFSRLEGSQLLLKTRKTQVQFDSLIGTSPDLPTFHRSARHSWQFCRFFRNDKRSNIYLHFFFQTYTIPTFSHHWDVGLSLSQFNTYI